MVKNITKDYFNKNVYDLTNVDENGEFDNCAFDQDTPYNGFYERTNKVKNFNKSGIAYQRIYKKTHKNKKCFLKKIFKKTFSLF